MAVGTSRATMAETAYRTLKAQIVSGALPGGHRLLPGELASALEISPTPVKEALFRLERDGLVETEVRRGMTVRRFRRDEVVHLYESRILIECHAVRRVVAAGLASEAAAEMAVAQDALLAALARRTPAGLADALEHDCALHAGLVARAGNPLIAEWHATVMTQTHTVRVYSPLTYTPETLAAEHGAIIDALRRADLPGAEAALVRHLERSRDELAARSHLADPPE